MQAELERALALAYAAVGRRDRTVAELRGVLERKRIDPCAIDEAVRELSQAQLLDDARYARRFAEDKRELEQWGAERIARELRRRGVAPQHIEATLETHGPEAELDTALALLRRRLPHALPDDRARDRAWRLLVRKGYPPELAYQAVRRHEREASEAA